MCFVFPRLKYKNLMMQVLEALMQVLQTIRNGKCISYGVIMKGKFMFFELIMQVSELLFLAVKQQL